MTQRTLDCIHTCIAIAVSVAEFIDEPLLRGKLPRVKSHTMQSRAHGLSTKPASRTFSFNKTTTNSPVHGVRVAIVINTGKGCCCDDAGGARVASARRDASSEPRAPRAGTRAISYVA
jgi:hypothetical protein